MKFVDLDNDGRLDIFIANGHVYPEVDKHGLGTRYQQRKQVFVNEGARFRHASAEIGGGLQLEKSSRGAAFGDYDNDGDIDVLVINMNERPDAAAQRHDHQPITGSRSAWSGARATATRIGARVRIDAGKRRQTTFVRGDGSYMSHSDTRAHFGLAEATRVRSDRDQVAERGGRDGDRARGRSVLCCSGGGGGLCSLRRQRARGIF